MKKLISEIKHEIEQNKAMHNPTIRIRIEDAERLVGAAEKVEKIAIEMERMGCIKACSMPVHDVGHPGTAFKVQYMCIDAIRNRGLVND